MQTTERLIKNAESKWQKNLQSHCREIFKDTHLPSHDEMHHTRVWLHARELLMQLAKTGAVFNEKTIEKLIIAVYFHDTGMAATMLKDHGKISRKIAKDYLKDKNISPSELEEILDAVEHHDDKEYKTSSTGKPEFTLQLLLNISDDLDALSFMGAYRYTEIYLLRNTAVRDLSDVILENLQKRFQHMKNCLEFSPNYLKAQNLRHQTTRNFFKDLSFQIKQIGDDLTTYNGPIGIVNFIKELMLDQRLNVNDACKQALLIAGDFYVTNFFEKVEKENIGI